MRDTFCPPYAVTDRTDRSSNKLPGQLPLVTVILFNRIFMRSLIRAIAYRGQPPHESSGSSQAGGSVAN